MERLRKKTKRNSPPKNAPRMKVMIRSGVKSWQEIPDNCILDFRISVPTRDIKVSGLAGDQNRVRKLSGALAEVLGEEYRELKDRGQLSFFFSGKVEDPLPEWMVKREGESDIRMVDVFMEAREDSLWVNISKIKVL